MDSMISDKNRSSRRLRAYARVDVSGKVFIHNEEDLYIAPLKNLSAGGCFVDKLYSIPEGSEVKIVLKSELLNDPIQAKGIVVRVEQGNRKGLAIEFTAIEQEARDSIQNLVYENRLQNVLRAE